MSVSKKYITSTLPATGYRHRRSKQGTAMCGIPAKQEDLTDDLENVNCPHCYHAMRDTANG